MAGFSTGLLQKLTITRCSVADGSVTVGSDKFEVMLNPSGFTHSHSIAYSNSDSKNKAKAPLGKLAIEPKFSHYNQEKVSLNFVIDGTGVVNLPIPGVGSPPVKDQIESLKNIVYKYDGDEHEPSVVQLLWGTFQIHSRLESMSVEYTLFKPSGEPLRAKVTLSFGRYISNEEEALKAKRSSPDLTHIVVVKSGDTLPLLCYKIYKDSSYYKDVARINSLVNFREIKPGIRLQFPPLR